MVSISTKNPEKYSFNTFFLIIQKDVYETYTESRSTYEEALDANSWRKMKPTQCMHCGAI
eukprot:snap_masked-scaffold_3-processed-gene-15.61-mRNA-1 protein AED:1.00 eAED:1.00 QI:0/0/0/0/1/1/3/0/59